MGPFELADLIGLDIIYSVSQVIYEGLGGDPAYTPPPQLKELVDNERFGIKNMRGVYDYQKNELGNPVMVGVREPVKGFEFDGMSIFAVCINESLKVLETKVAQSREDVNRAIQIGGSWTKGPFDLLELFKAEVIRQTLSDRFEKSHGQARYKSCELLKSA
jgi:3-hydroxyacyl-CoA dehydrogenase